MKAFKLDALSKFEDKMVQHVRQFTPKHSEILGEDGVREVIQLGMDRAKSYDFTNQGPVSFYIELMLMLGSDFDTDTQYPWAGNILGDPSITNQMQRADGLYVKAMDYVENVVGTNSEYNKEAILKVSQLGLERLIMSGGILEDDIIMQMSMVHPKKCEYLGESALRALVSQGIKLAGSFDIYTSHGGRLLAGLMFCFGHGCCNDPQFRWIVETLNRPYFGNSEKRVDRLYSKWKTYLDCAVNN